MRHIPVLLDEVIESLQLGPGKNVVDCTLGDGGHAAKILEQTAPLGKLLGIDADPESILRAKQFLHRFGERAEFVRDNFVGLKEIVKQEKFGPVHAVLLDLGWSAPQFEERKRGFSFKNEAEPLDMRYNSSAFSVQRSAVPGKTAAEIVNRAPRAELESMFREYGEEKLAKEIARAIVDRRADREIETVGDLVSIVLEVYRHKLRSKKEVPWVGGLHPATKVFQALRMAVNNELGALERVLPQAVESLAPGGRLAVITFHSLEDRIVKHWFKKHQTGGLRLITKKPITPGAREIKDNPRAASAKLRVVEKI